MDWLRRHGVGPRRATEPQHEAAESRDSGMPTPPNSGAAAPYRRTAYVPSVVPGPFAADSGFGGQPYLAPGVTNPSCPRCDEPMPLIAQIALDAQPTPVIAGTGLLQLFIARVSDGGPCDVALEGWEAFSPCHVSRLVAAGSGGTSPTVEPPFESKRITGWTPADDYPNWEELGALGADAGEPPDDVEPFPLEGEKLERLAGVGPGHRVPVLSPVRHADDAGPPGRSEKHDRHDVGRHGDRPCHPMPEPPRGAHLRVGVLLTGAAKF